MSKVLSPSFWIFSFFAAVIILYHIFGYVGHFGYDDMEYARISHGFTQGNIDFSDHFAHRWTMLGTTALAYFLFGVNDFSSSLPAILVTLTTLAFIIRATDLFTIPARVTAASLFTLNHHSIFYSDKLMPDIWVALAVLIALYAISHHMFIKNRERPLKNALILALALIFGFLSKGSILLFIPPLIVIGTIDLIRVKDYRFWAYSLGFTITLFGIYFLTLLWITDSAFVRFEAIAANAYLNKCSYLDQPIDYLIDRIGTAFWVYLIEHYMVISLLFVFTGCLVLFKSHWWKLKGNTSFWLTSGLLLMLSSAYMTISFDGYSPMCLDPRHYLFFVPVCAIAAAPVYENLIQKRLTRIILFVFLALTWLISFSEGFEAENLLYLPLTVVSAIIIFLPLEKNHVGWAFSILLGTSLSVKPIAMVIHATQVHYEDHWIDLKNNLQKSKGNKIILTNDVQRNLAEYHMGFDTKFPYHFVDYQELEPITYSQNSQIYLYTNFFSNFLSKNSHNQPGFVKSAATNYDLIDSTNYCQLYKLPYYPLPRLLFEHKNRSTENEKIQGKWYSNAPDSSATFEYLQEYSSTFILNLDSLRQFDNNYFSFSIQGEIKALNDPKCYLVIQITDSTQTIGKHWESVPINPFLKSYGHWWPTNSNLVFNLNDYSKGSILKAFFWRPQPTQNTARVKDMNAQISIFGSPN